MRSTGVRVRTLAYFSFAAELKNSDLTGENGKRCLFGSDGCCISIWLRVDFMSFTSAFSGHTFPLMVSPYDLLRLPPVYNTYDRRSHLCGLRSLYHGRPEPLSRRNDIYALL